MLVFYPLEYISFFSSPLAPVLRVSPSTSVKAQIWSIRAWGAYVGLHILQLRNEWNDLVRKECIPKGGVEDVKGSRDEDTIKKRKQAIIYQLVADISRLPVILHWYVCFLDMTTFGLFLRCILLPTNRSVIGGIYKSDVSLFFHVLPLHTALTYECLSSGFNEHSVLYLSSCCSPRWVGVDQIASSVALREIYLYTRLLVISVNLMLSIYGPCKVRNYSESSVNF